ncbi:MAG: hypothetical protein AAF191_16310 [Verrucomicrobiota bacterium]
MEYSIHCSVAQLENRIEEIQGQLDLLRARAPSTKSSLVLTAMQKGAIPTHFPWRSAFQRDRIRRREGTLGNR